MVDSVFAIPRRSSPGVSQAAHSFGSGIAPCNRAAIPLQQFVAGPENALADLAAASVTDQWVRFNPLLLSGPAAVGKTHLLHCLVEASQIVYPNLLSQWLTGADFARTIANGIDVDSLDDVRDLHRTVDLFILDGLHELAAKPLAQQELVHTIDYLIEQDSQVIVSSRIALDEISSLLPTLVSRLSSGLHIPLVPPAAKTRGVILAELAQQNDVSIPSVVSHRLTGESSRKRSKPFMVNDLTAAIAELRCFSEKADDQATNAVDRIVSRTDKSRQVTAKEINKRVAKYFSVTVRELTGNSRRKTVVRARALSVYLIRNFIGSSFQAIGQNLGGRDHTTVMHALQRANEWLDSDAGFARAASEVGATFE